MLFRSWDGSNWATIAAVINGNLLVNGTVAADKIAAGNLSVAVNISTGSIKAASGSASETIINSSGVQVGRGSDYYLKLASYPSGSTQAALMFYNSSNSLKGFLTLNSGGLVISGSNSSGDSIQSFEIVSGQNLRAFSSSDPRTIDAPLYTPGGAYIAKSLDVGGTIYGAALSISGSITYSSISATGTITAGGNITTSGDIHLGTGGTNRWLYDCNNNRILQYRYPGVAPTTLADVINVLQHHGLCN